MPKNYEIPKEILDKHNVANKNFYTQEKTFYQTFLTQTDYICNKIVEGVATWDDYEEEKVARSFAREQLSNLESEVEE